MKKVVLIIVLVLVAFPLCLVVWAGLDAAGGSLINCRTVQSDTSTLTLDMVAPGTLAITGDISIEKNSPKIFLSNTGIAAPSYITYRHQGVTRSFIGWDEGTNALQISSTGTIRFPVDNGVAFISEDGSFHTGTESANFRLDAKAGGVIGTVDPCAVLDDLTAAGTFNGTVADDVDYKVEIDANGTPDTFKWSDDGGSTWDVEDVNITEAAQTLNNGITVTFDANDGHTTGDYWTWTVTIYNPMWLQDAAGDGVLEVRNDGQVIFTGDSAAAATTVSAWEIDGNDDLMPITGMFNDPDYDLDSNGDLMPAQIIYFETDTSGNLMPNL